MNREELSDVIGRIVQNPEFTSLVREMQGKDANEASDMDSAEILSHLPEMMSVLEPLLGKAETGGTEKAGNPPDSKIHVESRDPRRYDKTRAEKLMSALKPYLKPERCEVIDKCMTVLQLTDVIGVLQEL